MSMRDERGRFIKGHIPINNGSSEILKGQRFSPETEFRKGQIPWNKGLKGVQVAWNKGKQCPQLSESKMGKKNPMFGKQLSKEHKRKIGEAQKGEKHHLYGKHNSEEIRQKISESHMGSVPWNKGKTNVYSEETLKKISDAHYKNPHLGNRGTLKHQKLVRKMAELLNDGFHIVDIEIPIKISSRHWRIVDILVDGKICYEIGTLNRDKIEDLLSSGFKVFHYPY